MSSGPSEHGWQDDELRQAELDRCDDCRLWSWERVLHELRSGTRPWWLHGWGIERRPPEPARPRPDRWMQGWAAAAREEERMLRGSVYDVGEPYDPRGVAASREIRTAGTLGLVTTFASSGGVGRTFLAANLAAAVASVTGEDVAVVDLDRDMGNLFAHFGREPSTSIEDLLALGHGDPDGLWDLAVEVAPDVFAFGAPPDPAAEPPPAEEITALLRAVRSEFEHVIVDATADYSDLARACFEASDVICVAVGLDVVGARHCRKALDALEGFGLERERFRLIVNRASPDANLTVVDAVSHLRVRLAGVLPQDPATARAAEDLGLPVVVYAPESDLGRSFVGAAEELLATT